MGDCELYTLLEMSIGCIGFRGRLTIIRPPFATVSESLRSRMLSVLKQRKGDSLDVHEDDLEPLKRSILWWMKNLYRNDRDCAYLGNALAHGQQRLDSASCGIVSYNAIAHDLFGDMLWTEKESKRFRVEAFNAIVMRHNERVSICH